MKINILFVVIFVNALVYAQQIKVVNAINKLPIHGVAVYNFDETVNTVTNVNGEANLKDFQPNDIIYLQHLSFQLKIIKKPKVASALKVVYLTANTRGLDEVVISASNFKESKRSVPKKISSVNAQAITFSNPQTSADLLENTGEVYVQKSQLGGGSPIIRGFSTNRLLLTVDGVRMNNAIFRGGNLQNIISIDPFTIQNTEVTLGAGAIIYGSDAIGGVVSFYTKKPQLSYSKSVLFKANAVLRYATASQEKTGHVDFNFGYKKWASFTSISYTDFDDLLTGKNGPDDYLRPDFVTTTNNVDQLVVNSNPLKQKFSGYNQINFSQKARFESSKKLSLDLGLHYTKTSNIPRYDRLIRRSSNGGLRSAEWDYGPQKWFLSNLQLTKSSKRSKFYNKFKAILAYQNFQESRINRDFGDQIRNITEERVDAYSFNIDFEKLLAPKTRLYYGAAYVFNHILSNGTSQNIVDNTQQTAVSRYPNGSTWQSGAIYTSLKYKPNLKWVFQSGLRLNHVVSKANFVENNRFLNLPFTTSNNNNQALTGSLGLTWLPNDVFNWKLNTSTAFRAPNIDDIGKVFDSEPGSVVVPNNNLKPEYAYNVELGLKVQAHKTVALDINTYYTFLDNALVRRDFSINGETEIEFNGTPSNVQAIQNASRANVYGLELGFLWDMSKYLSLRSQYNIINGKEFDGETESPVRHVAPNFGNTHLIWNNNKVKLDLFANYNGALPFNELALSERRKVDIYALDANGNPHAPSWYTLNLRSQFNLNTKTVITSSLENITSQRYRTYSSGISAPGRNFILSLKYTY